MVGRPLWTLCVVQAWAYAVEQVDNADMVQTSQRTMSDNVYDEESENDDDNYDYYYEKTLTNSRGKNYTFQNRYDTEKFYSKSKSALTSATLFAKTVSCTTDVLGQYDPGDPAVEQITSELHFHLGTCIMGLWLAGHEIRSLEKLCAENSTLFFQRSREECLQLMSPMSSSSISYCDEYCVGALDELQIIFDEHRVCPSLKRETYSLMAMPFDNFDCVALEPVEDNSKLYPDRANIVKTCEACVQNDCTGKTTVPPFTGGSVFGAGQIAIENFDVETQFADIPGAFAREHQVGPIDLTNYAEAADLKMATRAK
jgi:hypothetical protein